MNWVDFPVIAYISASLWILAFLTLFITKSKKTKLITANIFTISGLMLFAYFITSLWINLERPPLRTLGETRLWYAVFLALIGIIAYNRWKYSWLLVYTNLMAVLFIIINLRHPEVYNKTLMPALQSPWFVPHVVVYILSYAMLSVSALIAFYGLIRTAQKKYTENILNLADNIVYIGFAFLTLGLLFGALWAKEAWGHYWTWDPKETWALLTFLVYLIYMHLRSYHKQKTKLHLWVLSISFVFLLSAWFGVNYMPSSKNSVHTYSQQE